MFRSTIFTNEKGLTDAEIGKTLKYKDQINKTFNGDTVSFE
ncbi:hypothetical protein B4088_3341 [Bacillus cereus]|uniref:Uncharacterized protein n=1 Tax=Bacillus cereus TaxID=1396 RepID=A0A164NCS9_BACCE|nr:hypothetical protein B4088_3341 [Bacillus cereus]